MRGMRRGKLQRTSVEAVPERELIAGIVAHRRKKLGAAGKGCPQFLGS